MDDENQLRMGLANDSKEQTTNSNDSTENQNMNEVDDNLFATRAPFPKIQGYLPHNIESWFTRLEAYFRVQSWGKMPMARRDVIKYNVTIMNMDETLYEQAFDVIQNQPTTNAFETLKQAVISRFTSSSIARLEQLTSGLQLGDKKPSHLLSQLQRTGATTDKQIIRDFWIQKLPVAARAVITGVSKGPTEMTLEQLASIADDVVDTMRTNKLAGIESTNDVTSADMAAMSSTRKLEDRVLSLEKTLSRIESKLGQLSNPSRGRTYERSLSRNRPATPAKTQQSSGDICWFHTTFGKEAKRCRSPCKFGKDETKN